MASNVQKIPLAASLHAHSIRTAQNRIQRVGKCYPCSVTNVEGSIITVKFEMETGKLTLPQVTMPLFGPEYIRYPIQKGDRGFAVAADAYMGEMSGLGDGRADFHEPANLSALTFLPCGNKNWQAPEDTDAVIIYGFKDSGVILRDKDKKVTFTLTNTGIVIDLHGNGDVTILNGSLHVQGAVIAGFGTSDQVGLQTHKHSPTESPPVPGS